VHAFERATQVLHGVERRKMFGYPAVFANGNMFAGLLRGRMVIKLGDADLERMLALPGAAPFVAMKDRVMKHWAVVPPWMPKDAPALRSWLAKAQAFSRTLPPKLKKKKASRSRSAVRGRSTRRR
jgi:TfoX/Sxy family transcriptional regulator of competence genes